MGVFTRFLEWHPWWFVIIALLLALGGNLLFHLVPASEAWSSMCIALIWFAAGRASRGRSG